MRNLVLGFEPQSYLLDFIQDGLVFVTHAEQILFIGNRLLDARQRDLADSKRVDLRKVLISRVLVPFLRRVWRLSRFIFIFVLIRVTYFGIRAVQIVIVLLFFGHRHDSVIEVEELSLDQTQFFFRFLVFLALREETPCQGVGINLRDEFSRIVAGEVSKHL